MICFPGCYAFQYVVSLCVLDVLVREIWTRGVSYIEKPLAAPRLPQRNRGRVRGEGREGVGKGQGLGDDHKAGKPLVRNYSSPSCSGRGANTLNAR